MDIFTTHEKHYIGTISARHFYYKEMIFRYYHIGLLYAVLPSEIANKIQSFLCSSLLVFATNSAIHYINPCDNANIMSIPLLKISNLNSDKDTFIISEDGLTFMRYRKLFKRNMEIEYLCAEKADIFMPATKEILDGYRYYSSYNIDRTCSLVKCIFPYDPNYGSFGEIIATSSNRKYLSMCASRKNVCDRSGAIIGIFNAKTGAYIKEIQFDANNIEKLVFSPDDSKIAVVTDRTHAHTIWVWDINTAQLLLSYNPPENVYFGNLDHHLAWSPNSHKIAISCRLNYASPLDGPLDENRNHIIDSGVIVLDLMNANYKLDTYVRSYITYITWKNNNEYIYYSPSLSNCNNLFIINNGLSTSITVDNSKFVQKLKTTLNDKLLVIYYTQEQSQTNNSWITDIYL
jgi:hypothetical protein